jgi:hypothetical protein
MSIEWLDVLKISASSSVLTASIAWRLNHFSVHRATLRRNARYLAQSLYMTSKTNREKTTVPRLLHSH